MSGANALCRSCGASVLWCLTPAGKLMPVNSDPVEGGNLNVRLGTTKDAHGRFIPVVEVKTGGGFVSHFATCKDAPDWRKR